MSITYEGSVTWTSVEGRRFHSNEAGDGPTLLALHGGGPGANAWDNSKGIIGDLAETFRVILLDLPGFGRSESLDVRDGEFEDELYARAIRAFLDERQIERVHLLAASMSGVPAIRLAVDQPDRVETLILKGPGGLTDPFAPAGPPVGIRALLEFMSEPTRERMAVVMHQFVPNESRFREDMVDMRLEAALRTPHKPSGARSRSIMPELARIGQPTLVIWGREDRMVSFGGALTALATIPNVQVHLWGGGTGHFVEWEHPEAFAGLVAAFVRTAAITAKDRS